MSTTTPLDMDLTPSGSTAAVTDPATAVRNPALRGPVLFATDGQDPAHTPAAAARRVAQRLGIPLEVVTVIEPAMTYVGTTELVAPPTGIAEDLRLASEDRARRYVTAALGTEEANRIILRTGQIAAEVCRVARDIDATLIVLGAAPHRRFRHTVSGARAAQVLRRSPCAVLSVAPGQVAAPRRVVCAIDFSAASIRAAQAALLVADECATVTLVHVAPALDLAHPLRDRSGAIFGADVSGPFDRLVEELRRYAPAGVTIETRVAAGSAVEEVLSVADEVDAELIVVGTHGPGLVERFFIGSVAAKLLHDAPCSVLAAPAPRPAELVALDLRMEGSSWMADPDDAAPALDAFSRRNRGRRVTVEVDDPAFGAQVQAHGYELHGITYDVNDRRIDIMLGPPNGGSGHLTRTITHADGIGFRAEPGGRDLALEVHHGRGHTLLLFD